MKRLVLLCIVVPNLCFASIDVRMLYIKAVADFSTCGNALMPWGGKGWQPDEVEQPYVLQAKTNRTKMQAEIDKDFYTEANLEKLFVALTNDFYQIYQQAIQLISSLWLQISFMQIIQKESKLYNLL